MIGEAVPTSVEEVSEMLKDSKNVIIAPGYGMAVAKAQHIVAEMTKKLRAQRSQCKVRHTSGSRAASRTYECFACGSKCAI